MTISQTKRKHNSGKTLWIFNIGRYAFMCTGDHGNEGNMNTITLVNSRYLNNKTAVFRVYEIKRNEHTDIIGLCAFA